MDISPGVISASMSAPVAFFIAIYAERIRAWFFRPNLSCEYKHGVPGYRITNSGERVYLRMKVTNDSKHVAKSCTAYLTGVIILSTKQEILYDSPKLGWPYTSIGSPQDIVKGIDQYLDIAYSIKEVSEDSGPLKFATSFTPSQLRNLEKNPASCKLTGAIISASGYRKDFEIDLIWEGTWTSLNARPME